MNGKLARDLRRLAHAKWADMSVQMQRILSARHVYQQLKKEYKDEKGGRDSTKS